VRRPSHAWIALPLVLAALAIMPHAWIAEQWPGFAAVFRPFCATVGERGGHALVFAVLGGSLLVVFPALRRDLLAYLLILIAIGVTQECVQLLWKAHASGVNEVHDLAVDLSAGVTIWILAIVPRLRPVRQCLDLLGMRG
jgi:hypothetical protein